MGAAVVREAVVEELAEGHGDVSAKELADMSEVLPLFVLSSFPHPID